MATIRVNSSELLIIQWVNGETGEPIGRRKYVYGPQYQGGKKTDGIPDFPRTRWSTSGVCKRCTRFTTIFKGRICQSCENAQRVKLRQRLMA